MNFSAVILAGGQSKRMGGCDKAQLLISGKPIIERTIGILGEIFEEIVIVTNDARDYNYEGVRVARDEFVKVGPLGGIYTGLCSVKNEGVFFVACDMPFLHNALIRQLVNCFNKTNSDAIVPRLGKGIEPLHALYRGGLKDKLKCFLEVNKGYSVRSFLETIKVDFLDLEDNPFNRNVFKNLNTLQDFQSLGVK